ncbi:MAG: hypothetical protein M5U28_46840 [Sandaracinaceae bacterium]|nr:hypothetical protein [Sandaracinaceae bacterium]
MGKRIGAVVSVTISAVRPMTVAALAGHVKDDLVIDSFRLSRAKTAS